MLQQHGVGPGLREVGCSKRRTMTRQTLRQRPGSSVRSAIGLPSVPGHERCGSTSTQRAPGPRSSGRLMSVSTTDLIVFGAIAVVVLVLMLVMWVLARHR